MSISMSEIEDLTKEELACICDKLCEIIQDESGTNG